MKQIIYSSLVLITLLFPMKIWSQNKMDFQKMKAMFEQRRPGLDTMLYNPNFFDLPFLSFETTTSDSTNIASWFIPNQEKKGTIFMVHGFDMNKSGMLSRANYFYQLGYSILLPDLRARGQSGGIKASRGATNAYDVESVYHFYRNHLSCFGNITFYGFSHGGRAILFGAAKLAAKEPIILESTPYYLTEGLKRQFKINLPMPINESALESAIETISNNSILLLIGDNDTAINEKEGRELISLSKNENSSMVLFNQTGHSIFTEKNKEKYDKTIHTFLNSK